MLKDLKDSTRQRMVAIELDFPPPDVEEKIVAHEAGVDEETAAQLVRLGQAIRRLETAGLREVASTRVLVAAGRLVREGLSVRDARTGSSRRPAHRRPDVTAGLFEMIDAYLADDPPEAVTDRDRTETDRDRELTTALPRSRVRRSRPDRTDTSVWRGVAWALFGIAVFLLVVAAAHNMRPRWESHRPDHEPGGDGGSPAGRATVRRHELDDEDAGRAPS